MNVVMRLNRNNGHGKYMAHLKPMLLALLLCLCSCKSFLHHDIGVHRHNYF